MGLPLRYILRNLFTRWVTTLLTVAGMGLVTFVFASVLMLSEGLRKTLVSTGSVDNVILLRRSAESEVQSLIDREQAAIIATYPEISRGRYGVPLVAPEVVVLITMPKRQSHKPANVVIRGIVPESMLIRSQVRIISGRSLRPGTREVIIGTNIARYFQDARLGSYLHFALRRWRVVGIFHANNTGFDSEIWGDRDQLMQAFHRTFYSSLILKLNDPAALIPLRQRLVKDPRLTVMAKPEIEYYAEQSEIMSHFIEVLGMALTAIFSLGAVIGAMVTMYSAVANRTVEIGTLRALGFKRCHLLVAFLLESSLLGLSGGLVGLLAASLMQLITVSTTNWQTFSELAFRLTLSTRIVGLSLLFALAMGMIGGFLPSFRASRIDIVEALRSS